MSVNTSSTSYSDDQEITGWVGWISFAGAMMILAGSLNLIYGLIAAINDDWVVFGNTANLFIDVSAWGWIHMIIGALVLLSGIGVFSGNVLARTVGVLVASIAVIANFAWLPVYPIWSVIVITMSVLSIWALTAHGHEMRS